jgi:putative tricarboxylic transport membrane protein
MKHMLWVTIALVVLSGLSLAMGAPAYPARNLDFIAPAGAGGGWDLTARMTARALSEERLVTVPIAVTNMPGGSGAVGITHMVTRRKGDTHALAAMGSSLTATLARKVVPYTYKDVTPIFAMTGDYNLVAVRKDAAFNNMRTLLEVFKRDPGAITVAGGSAPGSLDHLAFALLGRQVNVDVAKVRYVPFTDGASALASVLGGQTTVLSTSVSEAVGAIESGQIRVLAVFSPDRLTGGFGTIPTAKEQGVDYTYVNWRGFYMPPDVPTDVVKFWEDTLAKMLKSKAWDKVLQETRWIPFVLSGDRLRKFLDDDFTSTQRALTDMGFIR